MSELWAVIQTQVQGAASLPSPKSDDQLDTAVSWLLAEKWLAGDKVVLLGNRRTGSFLLPESPDLVDAFETFCRHENLLYVAD